MIQIKQNKVRLPVSKVDLYTDHTDLIISYKEAAVAMFAGVFFGIIIGSICGILLGRIF